MSINKFNGPNSDKIEQFFENWKKNHGGDMSGILGHNIYILQTEDRDGKIIDEKYALNVTTDRYFWAYFGTESGRPSLNNPNIDQLFVGDGTYDEYGEIDPSVSHLNHMTYGSAITRTTDDQERIEHSTFYWDSTANVMYSTNWVISGYLDYVLSGISSTLTITEVGLATANDSNQLATHAYVVDAQGQYSSIEKHVNEKLSIGAYIITYHKPGYIENKLWAQGIGFAWNPWACRAFGWSGTGYNWNSKYNGTVNVCSHQFISSPRWSRNNNSNRYSDDSTYRASKICATAKEPLKGSYDSSTKIVEHTNTFNSTSSLVEAKDRYYDQVVLTFCNEYGTDNASDYGSQGAIVKDVYLDTPEEIATDVAYCRSISSSDLSVNFGYWQNSKMDARGLLPVTNMNITELKAYNGLTKDWDIVETVNNPTNTYNLTRMQMYPWVGIYMYCPYFENNVLKNGRQFVRVYFNMYTSYPITSISTTAISAANIWCTDTYWDTTSWVRVEDPTNVPASLGSKKYFIGFGGGISGNSGPDTRTQPVEVTRSGYTIPVLQTDEMTTLTDIDNYNNGAVGYTSSNNHFTFEYVDVSHIIPNDDNEYIFMRSCVYYPELQMSLPITTTATESYTPAGNMRDPIPSLRFGEPSGKRVLQVFRASNHNAYVTPNLQYVSVFDVPSKTDLENDPTLTLTEHVVELGSTFLNTVNYTTGKAFRVQTTETGYVMFNNPDSNRTHIVNMLGDPNDPDHEPYSYILKYPGTNDEIQTSAIWPIKYTNMVVGYDPDYTTDTERGFIIIDIENDTIVDRFRIDKTLLLGLRWIAAVNDKIYVIGDANSDWTSTWRCFLYDLAKPSGNRLVMTEMSNAVCRSLVPGGNRTDWAQFCWIGLMDSRTYGDDECILGAYCPSGDTTMGLYYFDLERPTEPVNFASGVSLKNNRFDNNQHYRRVSMDICKFNDNKQRMLIVNSNIIYYYIDSTYYYQDYNYFFDANLIRDTRSGPTQMNINSTSIPRVISISDRRLTYSPVRIAYMYKGKVWLSEYSINYSYTEPSWHDYRYVLNSANTHRIVDPKRLLPHRMVGTTTTIQAYNNPKRIYGISGVTIKLINSPDVWDPSSPNSPDNQL